MIFIFHGLGYFVCVSLGGAVQVSGIFFNLGRVVFVLPSFTLRMDVWGYTNCWGVVNNRISYFGCLIIGNFYAGISQIFNL